MRIITGALIIILFLLMGYSASRYKAPEIQADIDDRTEEHLASTETAGDLVVDTDGRHVALRGYATSEAEKERLLEEADDVWGALGPIDEIKLLKVSAPFELNVIKDRDGRAILRGVVPNETARLALIEKAEAVLGDNVESELSLAAGVPDGDWIGLVSDGMDGLSALNHGRLSVVDQAMDLSGEAPLANTINQIEAMKGEAREGFSWTSTLDLKRPPVTPFTFSVAKGQDSWQVEGYAPDNQTREQLLTKIKIAAGDADVEANIAIADGMPSDDWPERTDAAIGALAKLETGKLSITDQDVRIEGDLKGQTDLEALRKIEQAAPGEGDWQSEFAVLRPPVTPFTFSVAKGQDSWQVEGYVPDEATRGQLLARVQAAAGDTDVKAVIQIADGMPSDDWPERASAAIGALAKLETGKLSISDHDVRIKGDVAAEADLEAIQTLASTTPGGTDWQSDLVVLRPSIRPYVIEIDKSDNGAWSIAGAVPDEASRDALIKAVEAVAEGREVNAKLQLADGMPGSDWQSFVQDRLTALTGVEAGSLRFEDYDVRLEGTVATLDDAQKVGHEVAGLDPEIQTELEALDPTVNAFLDLRLSPDDGVTVNGALPPGLSKTEAVELLGIKAEHDGVLSENGRGDAKAWRQDLATIGGYLPEFETVDLSLRDGRADIDGETHAKTDAEQVIENLSDALDERWQPELAIKTTNRTYPDGVRRTNRLSGIDEEYRRGFWLPVTTIAAGLDACRTQTSLILATNKITFLVGEARLDARARRIINNLSSVAIGCLDGEDDLRLEIGGHTDSRGADDMNQRLSKARANAVLNALIARGVADVALIARGYGETKPIADNASEEGRSANRRITFEWLGGQKADG